MSISKGLLPFNHRDNTFAAKCLSASDLDGGTIVGDSPTSIVYDSEKGFTSAEGLASLLFTFPTALKDFSVSYEIESAFIDESYIPSTQQYLFVLKGTGLTQAQVRHNSGSAAIALAQSGEATQKYTFDLSEFPTFVRVDWIFNSYGILGFIDGIPALGWPWKVLAEPSKEFTSINIGGLGTSANRSPYGYYIRNVQVIPYAYRLSVNSKYNFFSVIGDSQGKEGQYEKDNSLTYIVGNATEFYSDTSMAAFNTNSLAGMLPTIHGILNLAGFFPGCGRVMWHGRGGSQNSSTASNRVMHQIERLQYGGIQQTGADAGINTAGFHGWGTSSADVLFDVSGTNDIISGITPADWKTEKQAILNAAVAIGCKKYIYSGVLPAQHVSGYDTDEAIQQVLDLNTKAQELADENPGVFIFVDAWTHFGGANYDTALFQTSNVHLSPSGQYLLGRLMAFAFIRNA